MPETLTAAQEAVRRKDVIWQTSADESLQWWNQVLPLPQGQERWTVVRTRQAEECARTTVQRQVDKTRATWGRRCGIWGTRCLPVKRMRRQPWTSCSKPARVAAGTCPREVQRKATFIVATNVLKEPHLSAAELIAIYKDQGGVERGFAFLKDPLFLASSVFLKKPARIMALAMVMVLCLLVYCLAEHRVREQLAATYQAVPDQLRRPTARPTLRWIFQCFVSIELLHIRAEGHTEMLILGMQPLHEQVVALLGPPSQKIYKRSN